MKKEMSKNLPTLPSREVWALFSGIVVEAIDEKK